MTSTAQSAAMHTFIWAWRTHSRRGSSQQLLTYKHEHHYSALRLHITIPQLICLRHHIPVMASASVSCLCGIALASSLCRKTASCAHSDRVTGTPFNRNTVCNTSNGMNPVCFASNRFRDMCSESTSPYTASRMRRNTSGTSAALYKHKQWHVTSHAQLQNCASIIDSTDADVSGTMSLSRKCCNSSMVMLRPGSVSKYGANACCSVVEATSRPNLQHT